LLFAPGTPAEVRARLNAVLERLPRLEGVPLHVQLLAGLRVRRGKLQPGADRGVEVLAGSDLRARRIVLEQTLAGETGELARIFVHELFHFVWVRLSNSTRRAFEDLLEAEFCARARGELGWSAERRKESLGPRDRARRTRRWRGYVAESFCDTAAWCVAPSAGHAEYTLRPRYRRRRENWFRDFVLRGPLRY